MFATQKLNGTRKKTNFAAIFGYWSLSTVYWQLPMLRRLRIKSAMTLSVEVAKSQEPEASCKFMNLKSKKNGF